MSICWHLTILLLLHSYSPGVCMRDGIVGGTVSVPHSRPYMVYILDLKTNAACGGFLIREDFILTAAHCNTKHLMVYVGVNDTNFLPEGIEVTSIPHPHFTNRPGDDIMLLRLETPVTLNKTVNTIALPESKNENIPKDCMAMGWGWRQYDHESPSRVLKEVNLTLIDCNIPDTICTKDMGGPSLGDSGAPLVCGGVTQGIVSYYIKTEEYLTVYTQISHYLPWIRKNTMYPPQ